MRRRTDTTLHEVSAALAQSAAVSSPSSDARALRRSQLRSPGDPQQTSFNSSWSSNASFSALRQEFLESSRLEERVVAMEDRLQRQLQRVIKSSSDLNAYAASVTPLPDRSRSTDFV